MDTERRELVMEAIKGLSDREAGNLIGVPGHTVGRFRRGANSYSANMERFAASLVTAQEAAMFIQPSFRGALWFASNMFPATIASGAFIYPSSENLYQALKYEDLRDRLAIARLSPQASKGYARSHRVAGLTEAGRLANMQVALEAKFFQHPDLYRQLKATDPAELVEVNGWHDQFWGDCRCGRQACAAPGANNLGRLLAAL